MDLTRLKKAEMRWSVAPSDLIKPRLMVPAVTDGTVMAVWRCSARDDNYHFESVAQGIDLATGAVRWSIDGHTLLDDPQVTEHGVLITSYFGAVQMLRPSDGTPVWSTELPDEELSLGMLCIGSTIIALGYHDENHLWAFDATTGAPTWDIDTTGTAQYPSAIGSDDFVHLENVDAEAHVVARSVADGTEQWRTPVGGWPFGLRYMDAGTPVIIASTRTGLFVLDVDGTLRGSGDWPEGIDDVMFDAQDGTSILACTRPRDEPSTTLLLDLADPTTPSVHWAVPDPKPTVGVGFLGQNQVLTQSESGRVSVRDRATGDEVAMWNPKTRKGSHGGFVQADDLLIAAIGDTLLCVRPED